MKVNIKEVKSKRELKAFVHFPNELYKGNPYYVPQIESMDRNTLTPSKNHAFEVCEGKYWLAYDEKGQIVGRIAGIINRRYNEKVGRKICRFGWIDFIDDRQVSEALIHTVEQYAREKGMDEMSGPTGFLEFDAAGVLVDGFDQLPTAYGKYNSPYYEEHLLAMGYGKEADYVEYLVIVPDTIPERYGSIAQLVMEKNHLHEAPIARRKDVLKYVDGIFKCMNKAYSVIHGFSELTPGQCEDLKNQFFGNVNIDYLSVILDENEEVVAFGICMPSLSKAMQKANGSLFPFGFIHVLHALKHNDTLDTLLIAIDDKYKNKGVNALIFDKVAKGIVKNHIRYVESTRELEQNASVQNLWNRFDRTLHKRARIYQKHLN